MQLYILDKNPEKSAEILFESMGAKYSFKMLIELCQMISTVTKCETFKPVPQGKEIQEFISRNSQWVLKYFNKLENLCLNSSLNIKLETAIKLKKIYNSFKTYSKFSSNSPVLYAPFRYSKGYKCSISSNSTLPIEDCIKQYKKYLTYKMQ